jgi:hypothetical protein
MLAETPGGVQMGEFDSGWIEGIHGNSHVYGNEKAT